MFHLTILRAGIIFAKVLHTRIFLGPPEAPKSPKDQQKTGLKLVIFCLSLSHFCDLFWNVTMILNTCFIWQFCGQVLFLQKFSPKKNLFAPPRGPKSPKDPHKKPILNSGLLWKILADSGWLWPTLVDFWWLWLTLADYVWPWLTLAESYWLLLTLADSGLLKLTLAKSDRFWLTLADYGWLWLTLADSGRLWLTLTDSGRQPESARVIKSHPESARLSQSQPKSAKVSKSFRYFWYFDIFVENLCKINTLAANLSTDTYVHYPGNILEQVTKVTQTITKYDQF